MEFQILGPLRVLGEKGEVPIPGVQCRAVLGYLLLHPNKVVSTSALTAALWNGQEPASARKVLHNSVMRVRKALSAFSPQRQGTTVELLTRAPGYLLSVGEESIDVSRFGSLVGRGRALTAEGALNRAAASFREALDLRRGPVLDDLAEAGLSWPERTAVENACLDAFEDYAEVELRSGRPEGVLGGLQIVAAAEPQRERLLGLCMTALFRCGRQTEALRMYERRCAALQQSFGVEPGRTLQRLYHAIRTHDPALLLPASGAGWCPSDAVPSPIAVSHRTAQSAPDPSTATPLAPGHGSVTTERRQVTVLQVRADWGSPDLDEAPEAMAGRLARMHAAIQSETGRFGGTVLTRMGAHWLVAFGAAPCHSDDPYRAVLCALAVRARFTHGDAGATDPYSMDDGGVRVAVASGLALVRTGSDGGPPDVTGAVVETCARLLPFVGRNTVWVCDRTRRATEANVVHRRAQVQSVAWEAIGVQHDGHDLTAPERMVGHHSKRPLLNAAVERFLGGTGSHVLTLTGIPGVGRAQLVAELRRTIRRHHTARTPSPPVVRLPAVLDDRSLALALRECCGIDAQASQGTAQEELADTVQRTACTPEEADRIRAALRPLLESTPGSRCGTGDRAQALLTLLERLARTRRLALVVDDVEFADPRVLDLVDRLTVPSYGASALVVADACSGAWESLPDRFRTRGTTVTVPPLADGHMEALLDRLLGEANLVPFRPWKPRAQAELLAGLRRVLVTACEGSPRIAHEYVELIRDGVRSGWESPEDDIHAERLTRAVPDTLRWRSEAALDRLPAALRLTLQDAATVDDAVWADAVAAAGGRDPGEVRAELDTLVRRGFLSVPDTRIPCGHKHYVFRDAVDRHVAHARIPLPDLAEKSANLTLWIAEQAPQQRAEFLRHCAWSSGGLIPAPRDGARNEDTEAALRGRRALATLPRWTPRTLLPLVEGLRALLLYDPGADTAYPSLTVVPCPASGWRSRQSTGSPCT